MNLWISILFLSLSLSLFSFFLKVGMMHWENHTPAIHWFILSILSMGGFLLLLYDDLHYQTTGTWLFMPGAILLNLLFSNLFLKEPLTLTKTTAYTLIISGIVLLSSNQAFF